MDFEVIKSDRRTLAVEITRDGRILVRAPEKLSERSVLFFLKKNEDLILKKQEEMLRRPKPRTISKQEAERYRKELKKTIYDRVAYWSDLTGLSCTGVRVTSARTRFGSCSGKNSLSFSLFLSLAREEEVDYVILHELCHTKEHNHSRRFYRLVERFMPDWRAREKKLKQIEIPYVSR